MAIAVGVAMVSNCFGAAVSYVQAFAKATAWIHSLSLFWRTFIITSFPLAPLGCIYRINSLRYFSLAGVLGVSLLAFTTIYVLLRSGVDDSILSDASPLYQVPSSPTKIIRAFSTITFSYVCHYNIPHIFSELEISQPSTMRRVALRSLALSTCVYLTAAICGFLAFGTEMPSDVLTSLQPFIEAGDVFVRLAVLGCVLSICVAHALHVYPIRQTAEYAAIQLTSGNFKESKLLAICLGIFVVYLSWIVAIYGPQLKTTIELVGASAASAIAYIFPALFAIKLEQGKGEKRLWLPYTVLVIGSAAGIGGTYYAVLDVL
jgi:amino acid permease